MPELPEVETVRRTLEPALLGTLIRDARVFCPDYLRGCDEAVLVDKVARRRVRRLARHGKYLYLILRDGEVEVHLGMTGRLVVCRSETPLVKHTHACFQLERGNDLRFVDPRRFGFLSVRPPGAAQERHASLGVEPLHPQFTWSLVHERLGSRQAAIKTLLLNQQLIAGLGNIYADEALFRAKLNPQQAASDLREPHFRRLHEAINNVITDAISAGGTTFADYADAQGNQGEFLERLSVYGREQEPCPDCGTPIVRVKLGGRSACYCPLCQPLL